MKFFLRFLFLVSLLAFIGLLVLSMSINALVKTGVETMGPKVLGVPITLDDVDISLLSGGKDMRASLQKLIIKNPEGYETDYAFSLKNIRVLVDRNSVLTDTVIIEEVVIEGPSITFEGSLLGNNLGEIQDNVKNNTRSDSENETEKRAKKHDDGEEAEKNVHIKKVIMREGTIHLSLFGGQVKSIHLTLPEVELRDIGNSSDGISFQKASAQIFDAMYAAIIKEVLKSGKLVPKSLEQFGKTAEEIGKSAEKVGKELLKGLFDK